METQTKKRNLIELPKATMDMMARCVAALKPPPELTLSQWADEYRMLSAESSAEPGRWHTDKAPYQREIMDAIGDPHVRKVVIMSAAQIGKTDAFILNPLGYYMAYAPAPILVMQPTLDMGQTFSKDRLAPMIRDTPVLRDKVDVKSRYSGNTILKKNFPGGHVTIVGANSATGLASRPIKVLLADEVDRYPPSAGTEGDPLSLAQKRQTTFWDKKAVFVSTPVIKNHSRIETEFNQSTKEEWNVPCPECGHYQPLVWANVIFDSKNPQAEVLYKCERCGVLSGEYRWKAASKAGRFVAENPEAPARGFHLNTLASTFCSWNEIVEKFLVAKKQLDQGNPEGMKVWVNTELGETWEEPGEAVEDTELYNRREIYDAEVPDGVIVLTAGVDVQDDRFEVEVVGWGVGKENWGIRYQKIYGDMLKEQVWKDLDNFLLTGWRKKDGTVLNILSACIDSGGHHTDQVYRFTKDRWERRIYAIKGKGGSDVPFIHKHSTNNRVNAPLFIIGVDAGKALLYQRLRHETKGPNYSNPNARVEYLYDAVGMTPAHMNFNTGAFDYGSWANLWFVRNNFPCMVKSNGVVDYRLDPNNYGLKEATGTASDVANTSYDGNAMSAIPLCWVKRYTEGGYRYVIICESKYDDGYEAYAHRNSEGKIVPYAFHAIFEGHVVSSKLRSLSGVAPGNSQNANAEETAAQANNSGTARWHIRSWALNELIYDLLTLIGKSTNLQATFGQGHSSGGSSAADLMATGSLNTKGQFFGYNTTTQAVKVFHMENFWADRWERICGLVYINGSYLAKMDESSGNYNFDGTDYVAVCDGVNGAEASGGWVKEATQNEFGWFPSVLGGSESTYDCDYHYYNNEGTRVPIVGGCCDGGGGCGRCLDVADAASSARWSIGASLSLVSPS